MGLEKDLKTIRDSELDIELLRRNNDKLCADNNKDIAELEDKIKSTEFIIEEELKISGKDKIECKLGSASWQKMPDKWIYIDEILMTFIINLPTKINELFLKTTITIRKADIKKRIMNDNDELFDNSKIANLPKDISLFLVDERLPESPLRVEGIEIEHQDPKFKYTIKKIKK